MSHNIQLRWTTNAPKHPTDEYILALGHTKETYWEWRSQFVIGIPQQVNVEGALTVDQLESDGWIGLYKEKYV